MSDLIVLTPETDAFDLFHSFANQSSISFASKPLKENHAYLHGLHDGLVALCYTEEQKLDVYTAYSSWINSLKPSCNTNQPLMIECAA